MKTYCGQMTKEQLDKKYFIPSSLEQAAAFLAMCENAGCNIACIEAYPCKLGIGCSGGNWVGYTLLDSTAYNDDGMTEIDWKQQPKAIKSKLAEAIAKRDKRKDKAQKAADKLEQAEKEVQRLIAEMENEVESIGGISCKIAEITQPDIPEGVDVDDPRTWQAGDVAQCISICENHLIRKYFSVGGEYIFSCTNEGCVVLDGDDEGVRHELSNENAQFRFVRRP